MDVKKHFKINKEETDIDQYSDMVSEYLVGEYKGVEFVIIIHYYEYDPNYKLVCIDRKDSYNKESHCPIAALTDEVSEEEFLKGLDFLLTEEGTKITNEFNFAEYYSKLDNIEDVYPKLYDYNDARFRFYNQIYDVEEYIQKKNKELGIDFHKENFKYVTWRYLDYVNSPDQVHRLHESEESLKEFYENRG